MGVVLVAQVENREGSVYAIVIEAGVSAIGLGVLVAITPNDLGAVVPTL